MTRTHFIFVSVLALTSQGCLRYVPSRAELQARAARTGSPGMQSLAGKDAFEKYENVLKIRVSTLMASRAPLGAEYEYRIGTGDSIEVQVFDVPNLSGTDRVRPTGDISLPLIGSIDVAGRTETELQSIVRQSVARYVRNPQIHVSIKEYQAHKVSVLGEVARPGTYPLSRAQRTLGELIAEAGGRTARGSSRILFIPAAGEDKPRVGITDPANDGKRLASAGADLKSDSIEIELGGLRETTEDSPLGMPLIGGDTVIVPEAGSFEVDGEVSKPGSYPISSKVSVLSAVAAAGGYTYSADNRQVELIRDIGDGRKAVLPLNLEDGALSEGKDMLLRAGDIVRVPSQPARFRERQLGELLGGLFHVGVNSNVP